MSYWEGDCKFIGDGGEFDKNKIYQYKMNRNIDIYYHDSWIDQCGYSWFNVNFVDIKKNRKKKLEKLKNE